MVGGHAWRGGHVWQGERATAADGRHLTGMHSCYVLYDVKSLVDSTFSEHTIWAVMWTMLHSYVLLFFFCETSIYPPP